MIESTRSIEKKDSMKTFVVTLHGRQVEIIQDPDGKYVIPPSLDVGTALKPAWEPILIGRKPKEDEIDFYDALEQAQRDLET